MFPEILIYVACTLTEMQALFGAKRAGLLYWMDYTNCPITCYSTKALLGFGSQVLPDHITSVWMWRQGGGGGKERGREGERRRREEEGEARNKVKDLQCHTVPTLLMAPTKYVLAIAAFLASMGHIGSLQ